MLRILYVATADARGHLMRAQLLVHALHAAGVEVDLRTTSQEGCHFLARFGLQATLLSPHYAVQFDAQQNMLRRETNRNVAHYVFRPSRMLHDMRTLAQAFRGADLVINDSFHPALLCMGSLPGWRGKVVHVFGGSLKAALRANFEDGRTPALVAQVFSTLIGWQLRQARACIEHDFAYRDAAAPTVPIAHSAYCRLATPIALAKDEALPSHAPGAAAVYLNPHFANRDLADALCSGLRAAGLAMHQLGEGLAGYGDWVGVDADWITRAAHARLIVSAPGMAALSIARAYQRPILLVLTDQPEQASNAARAAHLGLAHGVVVWRGDAEHFRQQVQEQAQRLLQPRATAAQVAAGRARAQSRLQTWVDTIVALGVRP